MKQLTARLAALILIFGALQNASAAPVPADWQVKKQADTKPFLELFKTKEKYLREKNLSAYLDMLPQFMATSLRNQMQSLHWDEQKAAEIYSASALPQATVDKLKIAGFKQQNLGAALILKSPEKSEGKTLYRAQSYVQENGVWKVGESLVFPKGDKETLDADLAKVNFPQALPATPATVQVSWIDATFEIGPVPLGMKFEWTINGVLQAPVESRQQPESGSGPVLGGLKKGPNKIEGKISKVDPKAGAGKFAMKIRKAGPGGQLDPQGTIYLDWPLGGTGKKTKTFEIKE